MTKKINLTLIIVITWMGFIILGYYLLHAPIPQGLFQNLLASTWTFLGAGLITIVAGSIGFTIEKFETFPRLTRLTLQTALGYGVISLFILLFGTVWQISAVVVQIFLLAAELVCWRGIRGWLGNLRGLTEQWKSAEYFQKWLMVLLAGIFAAALIIAFAPPVKYDALNYHLTMPKAYLLNQKITDLPWMVMSGMPQTTEMLYLAAMSLAGESAALVMNWIFGLLTLLGLVGFLTQRIDSRAAWAGGAALFSGFSLASALAWGYVGWLSALFGLCVILLLDHFVREAGGNKAAFWAGCFGGLAFSTKYPAGLILAAGGLTLILSAFKSKQPVLKTAFSFGLGGVLSASPWLIKNLIFTGNPLYPFFWEAAAMNAVRIGVYQGAPTFGDWMDLFLLPIKAFLTGVEGTMGYSISTGALLLAFGLLAFIHWTDKTEEDRRTLLVAGVISAIGFLIWTVGNQLSGYMIQTRFYFVLFPAFAVLAGFGYHNLINELKHKPRLHKIFNGIIVIIMAFNFLSLFADMVHKDALSLLFGETTRDEYLKTNLGWYALAVDEINRLPQGSKVMMVYEPRGYGCLPNCDPDEILDQWKTQYPIYANNAEMETAWKNAGFTHLLVYNKGVEFLRLDNDPHHPIEDLDALEDYLAGLTTPLDIGGFYALYEIP